MGRIQSSVGLITGIPIQETVNKLMAIAARPKDLLADRTTLLQSERLAISQLSSLLLAFQFETNQLSSASLYEAKTVSSSDAAALAASIAPGGKPAIGSFQFTPVQTAAAQQLLGQSVAADEALGAGSFTFRVGGFVDKGISLDELNAGAGVRRGQIRITDRNGDSAVIDLSFARTVDDVLRAINNATDVNVTAAAVGDQFKLIDNTGGSGNLSVQNVAGGATAIDLGLAGINVAADEATGSDVFALHSGTKLSFLNDGTGVQFREGNDLSITLADASTLTIDLSGTTTLGDVIDALNAADPAKLSAAISADGNRLELTDLTSGAGAFAVTSVGTGTAAEDLGLTVAASGDTITGSRLVSGLRDTLVAGLKGGQGLGTLGSIDITNRDNVSFSVDLSAAETLGEIIEAINAQSTDVTATVNASRNGIVLTDTTGGAASPFIVADGDANESATALGIVVNDNVTQINGGELGRRQIGEATLLSALNGGKGIKIGDFLITDTNGQVGAVDLNPVGNFATTVGDVIARINAAGVGVEARISDSGNGIVLVDTAGGAGTLSVSEVGNGTTAKDLRILGSAVEVDIEGTPTQVIDGTGTVTVEIGEDDTLVDLVATINALNRGVTAGILNDGVGQRLTLTAGTTGAAGELLIDTTASSLSLQEVAPARDAVLLYGSGDSPTSGLLIGSSTNTFSNVVNGLDVTIQSGTSEPVTVTVAASNTSLTSTVQELVDAYNSIRDTIDETTVFNEEDLTTGILFGRNEPLRIESDLTRILTSRFFGVGEFQSLETIGLSLNDKGKLQFDASKFNAAFAEDPESLRTLFTHETLGIAAKLNSAIEQLAGTGNSLLTSRGDALDSTIETNKERIAAMEARLEREQGRLLAEFARIESVVAGLQRNLSALSSLQILPSLIAQRSSSTSVVG